MTLFAKKKKKKELVKGSNCHPKIMAESTFLRQGPDKAWRMDRLPPRSVKLTSPFLLPAPLISLQLKSHPPPPLSWPPEPAMVPHCLPNKVSIYHITSGSLLSTHSAAHISSSFPCATKVLPSIPRPFLYPCPLLPC